MTDKEKEKQLAREKKAQAKLKKQMAKAESKKNTSGKIEVSTPTEQELNSAVQESEPKGFFAKWKKKHELKKKLYDKKDIKPKKEKEKHDYKLAFKEFPVKMVKEVSKIKWSGKKNLTKRFIQVIIFMLCSAVFFFLIDLMFQAIFHAAHVIM